MTWKTYSLEQIVGIVQSGFACGNKGVAKGFRHLRMNNIHPDGRLDLSLIRTVPPALAGGKYRLQRGDIIVCTTNSGKLVGKSALFNIEGNYAFSNHLTQLRVKPDIADPAFVQKLFWLKWKLGEIEPLCKHWVNQSTLSKEALLALKLQLPTLDEQRRITGKLDRISARLDEVKARLATVPALIKHFRQSILAAACSGRLTKNWRRSNNPREAGADLVASLGSPDPVSHLTVYEDSKVWDLPASWCWVPLGKLGRFMGGGTPSTENPAYWKDELPWVTPKDMKRLRIADSIDHVSETALRDTALKKIPTGAILFVVRGMILNHTLPVAMTDGVVTLNQDMKALIPIRADMAEYVFVACRAVAMAILFAVKEATHGTRRIEMSVLKNWAIPIPPLEEQKEIVRRVENLMSLADAIEARYNKAMAFVDKLMPSVLAKAFRGELT